MLTVPLFSLLVLLVALQRGAELVRSRRNERALRELGAREHAPGQLRAMQLLHTGWLVCMLLELALLQPKARPWLAIVAGLAFAVGQALRHSAMRALGVRWSVRILTLPGAPPVAAGIYRYLRHPNYLGVALEVAALPLIHAAWRTALVFSLLNALLLWARIRAEERALDEDGRYHAALAGRPRLWPSFRAKAAP